MLANRLIGMIHGEAFSATGGTITTVGAYTIHTFTTSGTFTVEGSGDIDVLIVGEEDVVIIDFEDRVLIVGLDLLELGHSEDLD